MIRRRPGGSDRTRWSWLIASIGGWTPFFTPINLFFEWWFLLAIPMAFLIAMIYKAMRVRAAGQYWRQVLVMTLQILLGMIALHVVILLLMEAALPLIPTE